jgi:hypothetical protein
MTRAALVLAGGLLLAGGPGVAGSAGAAGPADGPACVGLVVDFGAARPGGGVDTRCVRITAGGTGADVLGGRAAYRADGLICKIDGWPNGPCDAATDRYWSYWHRPAGADRWIYSTVHAGGYTVRDGGLEGWSFQSGAAYDPPPDLSHDRVCPPDASAAAAPPPRRGDRASPLPAGTVAGGLLVGGLAVAALLRARRGRRAGRP